MAFNTLEYLKEGKVDFVYSLTSYDYNHLIENVRRSSNKEEIINGFLYILKDNRPRFCFSIIYDIEQFSTTTSYLLENHISYELFTPDMLKNFLTKTSIGKEYVLSHLEDFISNTEMYEEILRYILEDIESNMDIVNKIYLHKDLHVRYLFMRYLVIKCPDKVDLVYDDIMKYLTSYTHQQYEQMTFLPELMDSKDISELARLFLTQVKDKETWERLKEYILEVYEENDLAEFLLNKENIEEFKKDADRLFLTSHSYKFQIYCSKYSDCVSDSIMNEFYETIKVFKREKQFDLAFVEVMTSGLYKYLKKYIDKYLAISEDKTIEYLESGSTASCYRVGDYVIKLDLFKWSYEEVICPDLYIILDNLEEKFIRRKDGQVKAGIEVQRYLKRSAKNVPCEVIRFFYNELKKLGYYITDSLINGKCGDNCKLLDSYKDYNIAEEYIPDILKQYPMVLIDRDRVYKLENKYPKQLAQTSY